MPPLWAKQFRNVDRPEKNRLFLAIHIAVAICIAGYLFLMIPQADYFVSDPDGGVFLLGGSHILNAGEHPQIDYLNSYGPLSFYLRALAYSFFGERILSEIILMILGYGISYLLLFRLTLPFTKSYIFSSILVLFALICIPRYYKFYVIFVSLVTIWAGLFYIRSPGLMRAVLMGASAGVAALFRQDYGVYTLMVAVLAIVFGCECSKQDKAAHLFVCFLVAFSVFLPWLLFASSKIGLINYLQNLVGSSISQATGLALPHPLLHWHWPVSGIFFYFYAIPVVACYLLVYRWKETDRKTRATLIVILSMSLLALIQSMHRADIPHLFQSIAPAFIVIPIILRKRLNQTFMLVATSLLLLGMLWSCYEILEKKYTLRPHRLSSAVRAICDAMRTKQEIVDKVFQRSQAAHEISAILILEHCTNEKERVNVFPYYPQIPFFADRLIGGGILFIAPGYLTSHYFQQQVITKMDNHPPIVILWNETFTFDTNPLKLSTLHHEIIHNFPLSNYDIVGKVMGWTIFIHKSISEARKEQCTSFVENLYN